MEMLLYDYYIHGVLTKRKSENIVLYQEALFESTDSVTQSYDHIVLKFHFQKL